MNDMPRRRRSHARPTSHEPRPRHRLRLAGAGALVVVTAVAVPLALTRSGGDSNSGREGELDALAPTGELNAMGMPVVGTPGAASGTAEAGGVEVIGADWDLGRVPLDVAVRPTWTLRNTGPARVALSEPTVEIREGCCPGPIALAARTLEPGAVTTLTFELSMHAGMDGPHDLGVHLPIEGNDVDGHLVLGVVGDFGS